MPEQSLTFLAEEQSPDLTAAYCYVVQTPDGSALWMTTWDTEVSIAGLPAFLGAADPQVFTPSQVRHGPITISDRFEQRATSLTLSVEDDELRRYFTTAAPARLEATILRIVGAHLRTDQSLEYERHCLIAERGVISSFTFKGYEIGAAITPEAFHEDRAIPRYYCQRQCNHALYGAGCGLDKTNFDWATDIVSVNAAQKEIVVTGQAPSVPETRFNSGHLLHAPTGFYFTIAWSAYDGANTKLKLVTWHPQVQVGDDVTAYHGCRKTVADCTLFGNAANFGGFANVPASNPTLNGVS